MKNTVLLVIDVGGSSLKGNVYQDGFLLTKDLNLDIDTSATRDDIMASFGLFFDRLLAGQTGSVTGLAMAFPGPADYERGIPLMRSLAKYESLYNRPIFNDLKVAIKRETTADFRIVMQNDARMYAYGAWITEGRRLDQRIAVLTLGTGMGSAFIVNGELLTDDAVRNQAEGLPADGYLYHVELDGMQADDWLSTRGLIRLAAKRGLKIRDGLTLTRMAEHGDADALATFRDFGQVLGRLIDSEAMQAFRPDVIYLGGNLSKAWGYFAGRREIIKVVEDSRHPLTGAAAYWLDSRGKEGL